MLFSFFYFFSKIYLHFMGYLKLNVPLNVLFLAFLFGSFVLLQKRDNQKLLRVVRFVAAFVLGVLLLWRDSWLPPPAETYSMLRKWGMPTGAYILDFLSRFYNPKALLVLAVILAASFFIRRYVRAVSAAILALLLGSLFISSGSTRVDDKDLSRSLDDFFAAEAKRRIRFTREKRSGAPFDIFIINICSISWADLDAANLAKHPVFDGFDYLFRNFNSVTSYSNPAVIRLLNSSCGQVRHAEMYDGPSEECSLFTSLASVGYHNYFVMNHNGTYGEFEKETKSLGNFKGETLPAVGKPHPIEMFDGSPVYNDFDVLEDAWKKRVASSHEKAAFFYNSVSLHDGSHLKEDAERWKKDPEGSYALILKGLLDDLQRFTGVLEASGRRVVVVVVAEHGRALKGNAMQIAGLRDIPFPSITNVPLGIKLLGPRQHPYSARRMEIVKPISYLAGSYILSVFVDKNPFVEQGFDSEGFIGSIPETSHVAENQTNTVMKEGDDYFLYGKEKKWIKLPPEAL